MDTIENSAPTNLQNTPSLVHLMNRVVVSKKRFPVSVIKSILLLIYVLFPLLSYLFVKITLNWFLIPPTESFVGNFTGYLAFLLKLGLTTFVVVAFIYMCVHYLILNSLKSINNANELTNTKHVFSNLSDETCRKIQFIVAFVLSTVTFLSTFYINLKLAEGNENEVILLGISMYVVLCGTLFVFNSIESILINGAHSISKILTHVRRSFLYITNNGVSIVYNWFSREKINIEAYDKPDAITILSQGRQSDYWLCIRVTALITSALTIYMLSKTAPDKSFHDGFPVSFFLTLLLFAAVTAVTYWRSLVSLCLSIISRVFSGLWNHPKQSMLAGAVLSIAVLIAYIYINNNDGNIDGKIDGREMPKSKYIGSNTLENDEPLVIVALSGGGIAASAWSYEVLEFLKEHYYDTIYSKIVAISSVSGGSLSLIHI